MAYVGASELVLTLPAAVGSITGSSTPLAISEVATICERVSIELDSAAAAAGYAVPVSTTATQAYTQMALWQSWGAAANVLRDIFPNMGGHSDKLSLADEYRTDYKQVLDRLRSGKEPLIGAAESTGGEGRELPRSYYTSNTNATAGVVSQISVGKKF